MLSTNTLDLTVLIAIFCVHRISSQNYFASNGPLNSWTEAQTWCNSNQSHLVEIRSDVELGNVAQFLQSSTMQGYYIALNAQRSNDGSWRWISGTYMDAWISVDNQGPTYTNYANINPTLTSSDKSHFTADLPTENKGFICQYTDCSHHADGWLFNGRCFVPVSYKTYDWFDASKDCVYNGGVLAQFDGINSSTLINSTLIRNMNSSMTYWIGLIRLPWKWQYSDTPVTYSNWASRRPSDFNQQCLSMYYTSQSDMGWIEVSCQSSIAAICEKNKTSTPVSTASPTSTNQPISLSSSNSGTTPHTMPSVATHLQPPSTSTIVDDTSTKQNNLALALGVGIGGGVGLIIIIVLIVVAAIICTRRRRERKPEDTRPIEESGSHSIYAQVIPSKDASESVESSPRNGGKELIYAELASTEEFRPNSSRQTMHPPDILPESFKNRQASVVIADNGDIYSLPHKKSSTSGGGGSSACLTSTTSI